MPARPLLTLTAGCSALLLAGLSGTPAVAATVASPAKGVGTSGLTVLQLIAGGHDVTVGSVALLSDTVSGTPVAKATITPLEVDGTAYGKQEITPANSPLVLPTVTSPSSLSGTLALSSPPFTATATNGPSSRVGSDSLGSVSLLGLSVPLSGAVDLGTAVTSAGAVSEKELSLRDLSLPSIGAILAALGLDVSKLPTGTLTDLVDQLDLTTQAIDTAMAGVDAAQAQVDAATATAATKAAELLAAQQDQAAKQAALDTATAALQAQLDQVTPATLTLYPTADTIAGYAGLGPTGVAAVELDAPGTAAAYADYTDAQAALAAAQAAVAAAQTAVDTAQAAVTTLTDTLNGLLDAVDDLALPVLNGTPLVSLDSLTVATKALATSNKAGGQQAEIVGGAVGGLRVLGTDVLDAALGSSEVDVTKLVGDAVTDVNALVGELTASLSDVLTAVPGFPGLSVPAPEVGLLTKTVATSISGGYGRAATSIQGLSIALPAITIPEGLALPAAADLPAFSGVTQVAGQLTSAPVALGLLSVSEQSAFAPAVIAPTVDTGRPTLPKTGLPVGVTAFAALLLASAAVLRRRRTVTE